MTEPIVFTGVHDAKGALAGYTREIPGDMFMDGKPQWAIFTCGGRLIGSHPTMERAAHALQVRSALFDTYVTAPFVEKTPEKVAL